MNSNWYMTIVVVNRFKYFSIKLLPSFNIRTHCFWVAVMQYFSSKVIFAQELNIFWQLYTWSIIVAPIAVYLRSNFFLFLFSVGLPSFFSYAYNFLQVQVCLPSSRLRVMLCVVEFLLWHPVSHHLCEASDMGQPRMTDDAVERTWQERWNWEGGEAQGGNKVIFVSMSKLWPKNCGAMMM